MAVLLDLVVGAEILGGTSAGTRVFGLPATAPAESREEAEHRHARAEPEDERGFRHIGQNVAASASRHVDVAAGIDGDALGAAQCMSSAIRRLVEDLCDGPAWRDC